MRDLFRKAIFFLANHAPAAARAMVYLYTRLCCLFKIMPAPLCLYVSNKMEYRIPIRCRIFNGMIMSAWLNDKLGGTLYRNGRIEPATTKIITALCRESRVFVDVGANIGYFTLVAARAMGEGGRVHSFEVNPECFSVLKNNVERNHVRTAYCHKVAVSDTVGEATLFLASIENYGASSLRRPVFEDSGMRMAVQTTTLDRYVQEHRLGSVDLMKIDVEGAERQVLEGAARLLAGPLDPPVLVVEFYEHSQKNFGLSCGRLAEYLIGKGYRLYEIAENGSDKALLKKWDADYDDQINLNVLAVPASREHRLMHCLKDVVSFQ